MRLRLQGEPHHDLSFQSTHPHGVRPSYIEAQTVHSSVVSIHAPTRGATLCNPSYLAACCCFNPRTHTGCDIESMTVLKGASGCFNPRTHTGCDSEAYSMSWRLSSFNPRTHTGCDLFLLGFIPAFARFNPRTHTGCDGHGLYDIVCQSHVSIHAPTRGATINPSNSQPIRCVSIHAPTRGATLLHRKYLH